MPDSWLTGDTTREPTPAFGCARAKFQERQHRRSRHATLLAIRSNPSLLMPNALESPEEEAEASLSPHHTRIGRISALRLPKLERRPGLHKSISAPLIGNGSKQGFQSVPALPHMLSVPVEIGRTTRRALPPPPQARTPPLNGPLYPLGLTDYNLRHVEHTHFLTRQGSQQYDSGALALQPGPR